MLASFIKLVLSWFPLQSRSLEDFVARAKTAGAQEVTISWGRENLPNMYADNDGGYYPFNVGFVGVRFRDKDNRTHVYCNGTGLEENSEVTARDKILAALERELPGIRINQEPPLKLFDALTAA
jgi:hypothetical protein